MIESIAIGSFDGVHKAHQILIEKADGVVVIERGFATLTPGWKRTLYIQKPTFFYLLESIKHYSPKEFIYRLQNDFPYLKEIVVGYDFRFGKDKSGSIETLKEYFNGAVSVVDEITLNGVSIHSRTIREAIEHNQIELANAMLDRRYRVDGEHISGLGLGSKELVPTINLQVQRYTLPQGVFVVNVVIENISYSAVAFIGNRVSIDGSYSFEVHILEEFLSCERIAQAVWVEFLAFLRPIQKFDSFVSLKGAIVNDIEQAKQIHQTIKIASTI